MQNFLFSLIQHMRDGVIVTGPRQEVQFCNQSYLNLTGVKEKTMYTLQELLRPLLAFSPDSQKAQDFFVSSHIGNYLLSTPIHKINIRHESHPSNPEFNFWYFEVLEIHHMGDHLRRILLELPDLFLWKDRNMIVQGCNRNFAESNKITPAQAIGRGYEGFNLDDESVEHLKRIEYGLIESGEKYLETEENLNRFGEDITILITRTVLRDEDGNFEGMLIGFKDVTEKKKLENELKIKNAQLLQSTQLAALGEMATGIAHEINNPLAIINSGVRCLEKFLDEPEIDRAECKVLAKEITETVLRVSKTISVLRSLSRSSAQQTTEKVRIADVVTDIRQLKHEFINSRGIHLEISLGEAQNDFISVERSHFTQVMLHLLSNAADAALSSDAQEPWIRLVVEKANGMMVFKVIDSGQGISQSVQENMFNPFYSTKGVGKGMGTGLSLSRTFVEGMNGKLKYQLEDGHTSFVIEIPT